MFCELSEKSQTVVMYINDNQSAHTIIETTTLYNRTKHIDIKHNLVQEAVEKGMIKVKYKPTNAMFANLLIQTYFSPKACFIL